MIAQTLKQIVDGLNGYLNGIYTTPLNQAELKIVTNGNAPTNPGIAVTLINVEEDKVYKNHLNPLTDRPVNSIDPIHPLGGVPAMRINLYVLFAFNPIGAADGSYANSLTRLAHVLTYFQSLPFQEIVIPPVMTLAGTIKTPERRFNLEINYHNISLEDSNNMWSTLGGEQKPYAMYQMRLLELEALPPDELAAVIQDRPEIPNHINGDITIQNL